MLSKNPGFPQIKQKSKITSVETINDNEVVAELSPEDIFRFKYAPVIISTDVKRSFFKYKAMLRDNCRHFQFEN